MGGVHNWNKRVLSVNNFIYVFIGVFSGNIFVNALKVLQKFIVLKPCCPKKGPTGGNKLALPAGIVRQIHQSNDFCILAESSNQAAKLLAICSVNKLEIDFFFYKICFTLHFFNW